MLKYIFTAILVAVGHIVLAQNASLVVSLVNNQNDPVSFHPVRIENTAIGFSRDLTTNEIGKVKIAGLSTAGNYSIMAGQSSGYQELVSGAIKLRSDQTQTVTLVLPASSEINLDEVVVRAPVNIAKINSVDAEVSSELTAREIQELPVEGRDITRALYRLPNVTQATGFFPEAPNVSINGANSLFNNYMIDGLDNNEQFLGGTRFNIPVGAVQNITVLTNNYSAEFGRTGNGIINVTTKSGSNDLTGEVFFVTRPGFLDSSTDFVLTDLSGNQVKDGFQRYQGGFTLGGPIRKDRTFFFINYEHTTDLKDNLLTSPRLGVNETVRGTNNFDYVTGKIDHFWSDNAKTSIRANVGLVSIGRQAGGLAGGLNFPTAANAQDRNSLNLANNNIFYFGDLTLESNAIYASFDWDYAEPENPDNPNVTVLGPEGPVAVLGHPGYVFNSRQNTIQLQEKLTLSKGRHTFKGGLSLISTNHELFGGGNPNGSYTVELTNDQLTMLASQNLGTSLGIGDVPADARVTNYSIELRPSSFGTRQTIYSAYLEDEFEVTSKLNLNLGLRYDYDNLSRGGSENGDFNNLAPRASFNYKLTPRSVIRSGYGIFYDKVLYAIYSDALQQNNNSEDFRAQLQYFIDQGALPENTDIDAITFDGNLVVGTADNTGLPFDYLDGPTAESFASQRNLFSNERRILNPDGYDNPYTHQFTVGYQHQMGSNTLFYVDLLYNRGEHLFRTRNINAPAPWDYQRSLNEQIARSSSWADSTRILPVYENSYAITGTDTLTGIARNVVMTETLGRSNYYAASFNLQKNRGEDKYSYRLIYTLSYLENNTEDINFRAMDANNFEAEWGPSINDRRHVINAIASYHPFDGLTLTAAALLQSGQPVNRTPLGSRYTVVNSSGQPIFNAEGETINTADLNGDGAAFGDNYVGNSDRFPGASRNSDRLPWSETLDLGVQYRFPVTEGGSMLEFRTDIFNLLDANNLSGYSNNATQSNQIQTGPSGSGIIQRNAAPPRQFQFSMRYLF